MLTYTALALESRHKMTEDIIKNLPVLTDEELEDKAEVLASASNLKYDDSVKVQKLKKKDTSKEDL